MKSVRAMLRPCFRESDLLHWKKASVVNDKWVAFLSQAECDEFYDEKFVEDMPPLVDRDFIDDSSYKDEVVSAQAAGKVMGVAVIKNAIVVNSMAYLQVSHCA